MIFSGRVDSILYENVPQAFYVLKMELDEKEQPKQEVASQWAVFDDVQTSVRGNIPGLDVRPGMWLKFDAEWVTHPKFGRQLEIKRAPIFEAVWDAETAIKMLSSNGVGELLLLRVKAFFGDKFPGVLEDPIELSKAPDLTPLLAEHISTRWVATVAHLRTLSFLAQVGIPQDKINSIWTEFGGDADGILARNPWRLTELDGFTFQQADSIATNLGLSGVSLQRVSGAVLHATKMQKLGGHSFGTTGMLLAQVRQLVPSVDDRTFVEALVALHKVGRVYVDRTTLTGTKAVYEVWLHEMESGAARMLLERLQTAQWSEDGVKDFTQRLVDCGVVPPDSKVESLKQIATTAVHGWELARKVSLSPQQVDGITNALIHPVSILTGLPGTGKSFSMQVLVRILQLTGMPYLLIAPTGIAAKRLSALTGSEAFTIHRAFEAQGESEETREYSYEGILGDSNISVGADKSEWGYSPEHPYPAAFVVADESSMLDLSLLYRILHCTAPTSKIIFVGDAAQLPSVGPGNVLRDMLASGKFPSVALTEVYRQKDTSGIIFAAHDTYHGRVPKCGATLDESDFVLLETSTDEKAAKVIVELARRCAERELRFQVLSPRHAGVVGVTNLNRVLREVLNPKQHGQMEVRIGNAVVRVADRVMIFKNDYRLGVYNGDIGKIRGIDFKSKMLEMEIEGVNLLVIRMPFHVAATHVRLAFATTVHKVQGQEHDYVIMPVVPSFRHQLQRNLFYTGITRAKKKVILVGSLKAVALAVSNDQEDRRNSLLRERLVNGVLGVGGAQDEAVNERYAQGDQRENAGHEDRGISMREGSNPRG